MSTARELWIVDVELDAVGRVKGHAVIARANGPVVEDVHRLLTENDAPPVTLARDEPPSSSDPDVR